MLIKLLKSRGPYSRIRPAKLTNHSTLTNWQIIIWKRNLNSKNIRLQLACAPEWESSNDSPHLTNSAARLSEHPWIRISHGQAGLSTTPGVSYASDRVQNLWLPTIASEVEYQPRPGREQHDGNPSFTTVDAELPDYTLDEVEASSEISFAIVLDASWAIDDERQVESGSADLEKVKSDNS